jgi:hypothetical protein
MKVGTSVRVGAFVFAVASIGAYAVWPEARVQRRSDERSYPYDVARDFGDLGVEPSDSARLLALARAVVDGRSVQVAPGTAIPQERRVVLGLYRSGADPIVTTAIGRTSAEAIVSAAGALVAAHGAEGQGRLELDEPTSVEAVAITQDIRVPLTTIGLQGVLVVRADGRAAGVLPGEIVERGMFRQGDSPHLDHAKIAEVLSARAGVNVRDLAGMRGYLFRAQAHVESARDGAPLEVFRGMVAGPAEATPDRLLASVRQGAEYLVRSLNPEGRYVYMYRPVEDRDDSKYGWLRHAGATYALLEAFDELGERAYLDGAERALKSMSSRLQDAPEGQGKYLGDAVDEEQAKAGGAGLALLALAKHRAVTGSRGEMPTMQRLARFIIKQQYKDGHFRSNADVEREDGVRRPKREPVYYQGEAVLGLMRLYALDPQQTYLESARRGADYVVHVRDAESTEDDQEHDHWMSYALNELYRVTGDTAYVEHALKIARAIQKKQHAREGAPAPDWPGTFREGQTTPGSTRLEAYDAQIVLSRFAKMPDAWLISLALEVARSTLGQQFDEQNVYWLRNPARSLGGVRESLFTHNVRIDYVQHAMCAWLHLARILRDPEYGKTGIPSQDVSAVVPR